MKQNKINRVMIFLCILYDGPGNPSINFVLPVGSLPGPLPLGARIERSVKIQKAHKIRLMPNNKQAGHLTKACGCARFAYNWALSEWKRQYEAGEKPNGYSLKKKFNSIKKNVFPFVTEVTKCAVEQPFANLNKAFKNFFQNIKQGKKPGYPRYKKRGMHDSFYISNDQFTIKDRKVRIPKLGWIRLRECLRFEGKILSATISRIADMWFISINVEMEVPNIIATGPIIGVDVGIKVLATTSDGRSFKNPKALKKHEAKLKLLQKSVSRKKKGSYNRKKAVMKLARQHWKISEIRKDSIHKATAAITKSCSVIGIEDLNISGMMRNHKLSKALVDASMSEFHRQILYKSMWKGVKIVRADRWYPSSKTCSKCGFVNTNLLLGDHIYKCGCGLEIDRDLNAAINLKQMAVGSAVTACGDGSSGRCVSTYETAVCEAGISHEAA